LDDQFGLDRENDQVLFDFADVAVVGVVIVVVDIIVVVDVRVIIVVVIVKKKYFINKKWILFGTFFHIQ